MDRPQKLKFVYFNPRPREGGDGCRDDGYHRRLSISIHAPARGATPCRGKSRGDTWHFNPRPREGGDMSCPDLTGTILLFQSTPPRGERRSVPVDILPTAIFQSTPPRGERPMSADAALPRHHFNPRPREGSDVDRLMPEDSSVISIHAPARGATCHIHSV